MAKMSKGDVRTKKLEYFAKLKTLLEEYPSIFIVNVDNVGSNQMHQIRHILRRKAVVLMGKNTMVRRALKGLISDNAQYEKLLPHVKGNIGFVFTKGDLRETRDVILSNRVSYKLLKPCNSKTNYLSSLIPGIRLKLLPKLVLLPL